MTDKHTCCGEIWHGFGFNRCNRGAKYTHEGNWYCKTHHPPTAQQKKEACRTALKEKRDAERKAREEAAAAKAETERRAALYPELLEALKGLLRWMPIYPAAADAVVGGKETHSATISAARAAIAKAEKT